MSRSPKHEAIGQQSTNVLPFPQPTLQLIYDTAPIGLAFLSPDCRYLQINQRLTEICGISVENHIGRFVRDCVPALADSVDAIVRSIMETGEPVVGIEVAGQRADQNEQRFWITYWHPQRGPAGDIIGVNVAAEEITERKRSEQQIQSAKEAAEAALQNLRNTQASLIEAEKLAALGRLVAGVAHEINSPVGTGLTVASSLEQKGKAFAAEVARGGNLKRSSLNEFLEIVEDASSQLVANLNRAAELIQSFKQVAVDRSYLDRRTFELGGFIKEVAVSLQSALRKSNLTLKIDCQHGLVMDSYSGPLAQVLTNLLLNSIMHAFPDGGDGEVSITARASAANVELLFSDNGCGMGPDVRRQAFDPFFTTRRNEGSTGLGLHIVHNIVTNRLGGRLRLESEPGLGTRIQFILPLRAPERAITK